MLLSALYFFLVLASYFVIRPLRDDMGVAGGVDNLPWLFTGTLIGMLLVHPVFTAMVSRLPRRRFIALSYHLFAAFMAVFLVVLGTLSEGGILWAGRVFYVWTSVFNLFVVSIFWSVMADIFRPEQGARLFGFIAVGGTAGAVVGSAVTASLAELIPPRLLLLASIVLLELGVVVALRLLSEQPGAARRGDLPGPPGEVVIGGTVGAGIAAVARSPYLLAVVAYMLLYTITATFLYFQQAEIVAGAFTDRGARTAFFARIDLAVNVLTVVTQVFLTGRIVRALGIALSLAWLPLVCVFGFVAVGLVPSLGVLAAVQILRRASNYAVSRPCREMLYTVLDRETKYKAKNLVDTFVYRAGDQVGAWSWAAMAALGLGVAGVAFAAIPLSAGWLGVGLWLGRRQTRMREGAAKA